jgi:alpha-mannosidase
VLVHVDAVPGFGWRSLRAVDGDGPSTAVHADGTSLANEHLTVTVDEHDGTLGIRTADGLEVVGLDRLVDGGDGGDTYSYSPPATDTVIDAPQSVQISVLEQGPVRAQLLVERTYVLPVAAVGDERSCIGRSDERTTGEVRTTLELRAGERFLRVRADIDNRARDHRLRAHFPLPAPVDHSDAECAFTVVSRGLTAEGGPHEVALPTYVSRRFVDCTGSDADGPVGLAVLHDGLLEYEVVGDGTEVALTLLRATGYLSRAEPSLRPNPAGPLDPLEGPQVQGHQVAEYALLPHRGDWQAARLHDAADELLVPLERVRGGGVAGAHRPPTGRTLRVEGAQVSAVTREAGRLEVRLVNASPEPGRATIAIAEAPATGWVIDLLGRPLGPLEGELALRPWEIVTLRLE